MHLKIFKTAIDQLAYYIIIITIPEFYFIKQVKSTKFLGIYIDSNLTWKTHIKHITTKIAKTTGIF